MIRINQLKTPIDESNLRSVIAKKLKIKPDAFEYNILRRSIDSRPKHPLRLIYSVSVDFKNADDEALVLKRRDKDILSYNPVVYQPVYEGVKLLNRPIVIGMGPAGLFAAYILALNGLNPIIFERGEKVEDRSEAVERFFKEGVLDPESNVQFGEGGAGTFSDGKLNTTVKDKYGRQTFILKSFVDFGAPRDILYDNRPHIGTDYLKKVIINLREEIIRLGAEIHYNTRVSSFIVDNGSIKGVKDSKGNEFYSDNVILAIGHSSRDTVRELYKEGVAMEAKPFAVGLRVEHKREFINHTQYNEHDNPKLPTAYYKLTYHASNGRNVFSFCMCPGGFVVNASSEDGQLVVNGMSDYDRMEDNSNAAIVVSVTPDDYPDDSPLSGIDYQVDLEKATYNLCKGKIPTQRYKDFKDNVVSTGFGDIVPVHKGATAFANLRDMLPEYVSSAIIDGIDYWDGKINGFASDDALLSGVESRTSSPVRIVRDENFYGTFKGLYPCGEGAGYAGGIMSAAIDGIKCAEKVMNKEL